MFLGNTKTRVLPTIKTEIQIKFVTKDLLAQFISAVCFSSISTHWFGGYTNI